MRSKTWCPTALTLAGCGVLGAWTAACTGAGTEAPRAPDRAPLEVTLPGRDVQLRWDPSGVLHLAYVEDRETDEGPRARIRYARWDGEAPVAPVWVSPPELDVSAHGEVPPTLERLPDGTLVIAYTVSLPGKWKGEIRLQRSTDGGATWSEPRLLHDDEGVGSHSFLASAITADGQAAFAWLDNRDGRPGLRAATTTDGGEVSANTTVDGVTCECCATELLAGADGTLYLAYRDMTEPAEAEDSRRDIYLTRSTDGGSVYGEPRPVSEDGWKVNACPHTGPRLAEEPDGRLWAAWFTGAEPGIWAASSVDGGRSFAPRQPIARMGGEVRLVAHPEIAVLPDGRRVVLWEEGRKRGAGAEVVRTLRARFSESPGSTKWGEARTVPGGDGGTFPRVAVAPDGRAALAFSRLVGAPSGTGHGGDHESNGHEGAEHGAGHATRASEIVVMDILSTL